MGDDQQRLAGLTRVFLPVLLLLSGFCGISYEILYSKLLGNLLGNQFTINATVLLTFLLGIGIGTLYAHRFTRYLWAIEAGIGIYAAAMAIFYNVINDFLFNTIPVLGTNLLAAALTSIVLLLVPAFLIGCSIPLFAGYLSTLRKTHVFSMTYGIYNIGAGLTALAMEFALLRSVGLRKSTLILAVLNIFVAVGLLYLVKRGLRPQISADFARFPANVVLALAAASVASAIFQLMMIKLAEFIFGPYNETFSLVLATVLLGLAAGSFAAARLGLTFSRALLLGLFGLAWLLAILPTAVDGYSLMYRRVVDSYPLLVLLKFALVIVMMGLPAVGFGATIPALLRSYRDVAKESGLLLFYSSVANALGFLLMAFVLHRYLDYGPLILTIAGIVTVALVIHTRRLRTVVLALVLFGLSIGAHAILWDEMLLYAGHLNFHALMPKKYGRVSAHERFKGAQDVFAITYQKGKPFFFINGYISIPLNNSSEKVVGALSAMLSPRLDEALVLGVGSGATASTVGLLFDHTEAVEINKVVLQNLYRMKKYNFDIETIPNLDIIHDDGIHYLRSSNKKYSLILNTVTTPLYFSSSKLYTKDLFDLVDAHLTDDGIYMTWIDIEIGDSGLNIILESLDATFDNCWLNVIKNDYFLLGCSNGEIGLRQYEPVLANPTLQRFFREDHEYPMRLLPYHVLHTDALSLKVDKPMPINTLDYPVLEFEMARLQTDRLYEFLERLDQRFDIKNLEKTLGPRMNGWDAETFGFHKDLRLPSNQPLTAMLGEKVAEAYDVTDASYEETALAIADEIHTARGYLRIGDRLMKHDHHSASIVALLQALELDPDLKDAHLKLGQNYFYMENFPSAISHFKKQWSLDRHVEVPIRMTRSLLRLGRPAEALEWLDRAESINRKAETVAFYRGMTYEALNRLADARRQYETTLGVNPNHTRARRAIKRLSTLEQ